jgi:hypothetical protein
MSELAPRARSTRDACPVRAGTLLCPGGVQVVATRLEWARPRGMRAGQEAERLGRRMPAGTLHAYRNGDSETLCGQPVAGLHPFPDLTDREPANAMPRVPPVG